MYYLNLYKVILKYKTSTLKTHTKSMSKKYLKKKVNKNRLYVQFEIYCYINLFNFYFIFNIQILFFFINNQFMCSWCDNYEVRF